MIRLGIIGAGNILETRHIPALQKNKDLFKVVGIMDVHGVRAKKISQKYRIPFFCGYRRYKRLSDIQWFKDIDAVLICTPPLEHYSMVRQSLLIGKHVLVEKPFVTDISQGRNLLRLARQNKLTLAVNHNFQFSNAFCLLRNAIESHELGKVRSFYSYQSSNDSRRLPSWAEKLPLGLFYDESPHVFYLLKNFSGGPLKVVNVLKEKSKDNKHTPQILNIHLKANNIPATIYMNFESPVCEWYFVVYGSKKLAIVDMFRDIYTILPHDGLHLMKEVFTTSSTFTLSHWKGMIINGFRYVFKKLHYGIDVTQRNFYQAVTTGEKRFIKGMTGEEGLEVNKIQHTIMDHRQKN